MPDFRRRPLLAALPGLALMSATAGAQSLPLIVCLRFDPDPISATALRREDPRWADRYASLAVRDGVTLKAIG